jgi:hypothetical protein
MVLSVAFARLVRFKMGCVVRRFGLTDISWNDLNISFCDIVPHHEMSLFVVSATSGTPLP